MKLSENSVRKTILHVHRSQMASIRPASSTHLLSWSNHNLDTSSLLSQSSAASKLKSPLSLLCSSFSCQVAIRQFSRLHPSGTLTSDTAPLHPCHHQRLCHPMKSPSQAPGRGHQLIGSSLCVRLLPAMNCFLPKPTCQSLTVMHNKLHLSQKL